MKSSLCTLIKLKELDLSELIASRHFVEVEIRAIENKIDHIDSKIFSHIKDVELNLQKSGLNMDLINYLNNEIKTLERTKLSLVEEIRTYEYKVDEINQKLNETNVDKKKYEKIDSKNKQKHRFDIDQKIKKEVEELILSSLGGGYANQ